LDPEQGMQVQKYQDSQAQQDLQNQRQAMLDEERTAKQQREFAEGNQELMEDLMTDISYFDDPVEAAAYADAQVEQMRANGLQVPDMQLTPERFAQIKQLGLSKLGEGEETVGNPYMVERQTPSGETEIVTAVAVRNKRKGGLEERVLKGAAQRVTGHDAVRAGQIAEAKKRGALGAEIDLADDVAWSKLEAQAQTELGPARLQAQQTIDVVAQLKNHPGRKWATGLGWLNPLKYAPGTEAHNFMVLADQADGRVFSAAYETLKGGGQITEIESRKASQAIARMEQSQSQEEYVRALEDFERAVRDGYKKLLDQATGQSRRDFEAGDTALEGSSGEATKNNPARPSSQAEYDALPSGAYYMKDGRVRRKR
ncbi:MAG: hypothetical protein ACR2PR_03575, partial [Pseudohongiellaceae bacterium]